MEAQDLLNVLNVKVLIYIVQKRIEGMLVKAEEVIEIEEEIHHG